MVSNALKMRNVAVSAKQVPSKARFLLAIKRGKNFDKSIFPNTYFPCRNFLQIEQKYLFDRSTI